MAHTKGPWRVEKYCVWSESYEGGRYVAATQTGLDKEEQQANALLIAVAPELLDILKAAVVRVELANTEGNPILSAWLPDAKAVLAKAERRAGDEGIYRCI